MTFHVAADAYDRFMGRFSGPLAACFADWAGVRPGMRALDVGSGPGALTAELVGRLGAGAVHAVEPSPTFVEAVRARLPGVDVRAASAEDLPFDDDTVDAALAQLVVHFLADPVRGLREMARVTRPGGVVAACVWDHAGGGGPLAAFWGAVHELTPAARDESGLAGARAGHLAELFVAAGIGDVEQSCLSVSVPFASFDDWWEPFTLGVGPAGAHVAGLDADGRAALRARCAELLPTAPFEVRASAWSARGRA
ncbi:class I SAM-dependent methyltransferase [Cellulomonas sp. NS3]|uniref:class I SAM-dependent methyltransferase n=1 Tax=Cellulomonas sp. NS3 TaxID=2973977 RepID=UPI0021617C43|nr:methyltransferase domain-containing protein [Cellulomonas sp. NS3]